MTVQKKQGPVRQILDPVHNLITFDLNNELEHTLWRVLESEPFQRLRRIKQLGFSELVYPGATHTRFAHSLGVFHTARQLMKIVRMEAGGKENHENVALAAALVHDIGHGPFSHAFENVGSRLDQNFANHEAVSGTLIRDGELSDILGSGFANDVADMFTPDSIKTVHNAVVSSQFDADRLDYMRRDSMMTGVQHSVIELEWLLANLEIRDVPSGADHAQKKKEPMFVIGPKAIQAAEAYILNLFHLYQTVYFHKTTRGAEKLFTELLMRVVELVQNGSTQRTGLPDNHPLVKFAKNPGKPDAVLALDDFVIWGALKLLKDSNDTPLENLSDRLLNRKLPKCVDIRNIITDKIDPENMRNRKAHEDEGKEIKKEIEKCCAAVLGEIHEWGMVKRKGIPRLLTDEGKRLPYENTKPPTERIYVGTTGNGLLNLEHRSDVVWALPTFRLTRVYYGGGDEEDNGEYNKITSTIDKEVKQCQRS